MLLFYLFIDVTKLYVYDVYKGVSAQIEPDASTFSLEDGYDANEQ